MYRVLLVYRVLREPLALELLALALLEPLVYRVLWDLLEPLALALLELLARQAPLDQPVLQDRRALLEPAVPLLSMMKAT